MEPFAISAKKFINGMCSAEEFSDFINQHLYSQEREIAQQELINILKNNK